MRSVVVAVVLVSACGGSGPGPSGPPTKPIVRNDGPPAEPDPHASRDALVKRTFVAIAAGDTPKLVELADVKNVMTRAMRCDGADAEEKKQFDPDNEVKRVERRMGELTEKSKGLALEVLEITIDESRDTDRMAKGHRIGTCEFLTDISMVRARVKVRVAKAGFPTKERMVKVRILSLENRWYLDRISNNLSPVEEPKVDFVATMKDHADRMCACKDKACAQKVHAEHTLAIEKMGPEQKTAASNPDDAKRLLESEKLYSRCFIMLSSMP